MRPDALNPLFAETTSLAGVGPALARALERLDIHMVRDLLFHLPIGWRHTRMLADLRDAREGERVSLPVTIVAMEPSRGRAPARLLAEDAAGGGLHLAFFGPRGDWLAKRWPPGSAITVAGRLDLYNGRFQMVHPEEGGAIAFEPIYRRTDGVTSRKLSAAAESALERVPDFDEWIEPSLLARHGWPSFAEALRIIHRDPESRVARARLAYDEMLATQLAWALVRLRRRRVRGQPLSGDGRLTEALLSALPWPLTVAQRRSVMEITGDMAQPAAMLRLLQGDVGSGKTLVGLLALLTAVEAGAQGAFLAPTDILARQHMQSLERLTGGLQVRLGFLSGREKGKTREKLLTRLADGEIDILVGTHAIFQQGVSYRSLGMAVIDEQHRFGVAQRLMLSEKAARPPHLLVMTATPIPRTLALANYGEMDVSRLDERPPGRQPIDTRVIALRRVGEVVEGLERHIRSGQQAYWVCPLLDAGADDDSDSDSAAPAVARARILRERFGAAVALVHGKLSGPERDREMERFQKGEAKLMVATTVIEVGVDVPNATLMVIESAESFGLAQLHQLRGRVGRGSGKSSCILLRGEELTETATRRLRMMRSTEDGFAIAEADLELRGAGELLGTRQSGDRGFMLAEDEHVATLLASADADARLLIDRDGGLEGRRGTAARNLLYLFGKDAAVATLRGG